MSFVSATPSVKARLAHLGAKLRDYEDQRDTQNRVIAGLWSQYVKKFEEEAVLRKKIDSYVKDDTEECKRLEKELERVTRTVLELGVAKSAASAEVRRLTKKIAAKKIRIAVMGVCGFLQLERGRMVKLMRAKVGLLLSRFP